MTALWLGFAGSVVLTLGLGAFETAKTLDSAKGDPGSAPKFQTRAPAKRIWPNEPSDATLRLSASADGETLFLIGRIDPGSYGKFRRFATAHPKAETLFLGSPGGIVLEGYLIGVYVREQRIKTYVGAICASSCTQILIAGTDRAAAPGAHLGFHESWRLGDDGIAVGSQTGEKHQDAIMRAAYDRSGIDGAFADRALSTSFKSMWYPSLEEMEKAHVLTRRSLTNEIVPPLAADISKSAIGESLLKDRMWQLLQQEDPKLYRDSVDAAWYAAQGGVDPTLLGAIAQEEVSKVIWPRMAVASDEAVEASVSLILDQVRIQKATSGGRCADTTDMDWDFVPDAGLLERERNVYRLVLETTTMQKPMTQPKALKKLRPVMMRLRAKLPHYTQEEATRSPAARCARLSAILEEIAAAPLSDRISMMRALMTLGDIGQDEKSE